MRRQSGFPKREIEKPFRLYTPLHIGIVVREVPNEDASFVYMEGTTPYGKFPFSSNLDQIPDKDLIKCYHARMTSHYTHGGPYQPLMRGTWVIISYAEDINLGIILGTIPDKDRNILPKGGTTEVGKDDALGMLYHHHSGVWVWIHRNGDIEMAHPSEDGNKWTFFKIGQDQEISDRFRQIVENKQSKTVEYNLGVNAEDIKPQGVPFVTLEHSSKTRISIDKDGNVVIETDRIGRTNPNAKIRMNPNTPPNGSVCGFCPTLVRSTNVFVNGKAAVVDFGSNG